MTPVDYLLQFMNGYQEINAILSHNAYQYHFRTRYRPVRVWVGEKNTTGIPVCQGSVNTYGVTLMDDGFILYANVQSDLAEVECQVWMDVPGGAA